MLSLGWPFWQLIWVVWLALDPAHSSWMVILSFFFNKTFWDTMKWIHFWQFKLIYWFNWSRLNIIEVGVDDLMSDASYFIFKEVVKAISKFSEWWAFGQCTASRAFVILNTSLGLEAFFIYNTWYYSFLLFGWWPE